MGTTANNGWTYPESTDLVKDGATAIQTLADDIDTTLGVYSASGLVLLNTTSFGVVSSQSFNNVFNANYKTYRLVLRIVGSGQIAFYMKLRASGIDTSSAYYYAGQYQSSSTTSEGGEAGSNTSYFQIGGIDGQRGFLTVDLNGPFESASTQFTAFGWDGSYKRIYAGGNGLTTSHDGFSLIPASGTITGSVSIYGYNE